MFKIGKMYICEQYNLMIYPSAAAARRLPMVASTPFSAVRNASYFTKTLGATVSFCEQNTILLLLGREKDCLKILAGDKMGWIFNKCAQCLVSL